MGIGARMPLFGAQMPLILTIEIKATLGTSCGRFRRKEVDSLEVPGSGAGCAVNCTAEAEGLGVAVLHWDGRIFNRNH